MVKIFTCLAIIIASTLIGKSFSDKHQKKFQFYNALKSFNSSLKRNVKFKKQNVIEMLDFNSYDSDFNCFLSSYKLSLTCGEDNKTFIPSWAEDCDIKYLNSYMCGIGKNGSLSELDFITLQEEIIDEKLQKIKENITKYSKLGQKLGFAIGAFLVVVII